MGARQSSMYPMMKTMALGRVLTSDAADMSQAMLVTLAKLVERDRTLVELADMPLGWTASRADASSPWVRRASAS